MAAALLVGDAAALRVVLINVISYARVNYSYLCNMMKKRYISPNIRVKVISAEPLLGDSTETLPFNPSDGTGEALSNDGSIWDEDVPESSEKRVFEE